VVRMAQLEGVACVAAYGGAGRVSCTNDISNPAAADRLRSAAAQVAGLRELFLQVSAATPAPPDAAVPVANNARGGGPKGVAIGRKFSILISKRGKHVIGPAGEKYGEGDVFDGLAIRSIALDHVVFERDGAEYVFYVAQMR
jgi:type II secretory pathway component PulC